ncbi:MAG: VirB4 family type IV secretion system protein [Acidimicrobiales bacterium]
MTPPAHRATTAHLGAAYPFVSSPDAGRWGVLIGRDLLGGPFAYDPFELYQRGVLTNPNMVVIGQIGRGKSSFVKSYLWRQSLLGRQAWVVDPKGEYARLARAWGVEPILLRPGGPVRLNPLDLGSGGDGPDPVDLLATLVEASSGRHLGPRERAAVELALASVAGSGSALAGRATAPAGRVTVPVGRVTVPAVVAALLEPTEDSARAIHTDARTLEEDGRDVALELRRLVHGDLRGMFDGPTSGGVDLAAPLVVLDLSAVYGSPALGILMTCAMAWLGARLAARDGQRRLLVIDEAWAVLANLGVARWLQASWKLSRAYGVANMAVIHHLSDLAASGDNGSAAVKLAQGLLADSETVVAYAQPPAEVERSAELLGLSSVEAGILPQLGRGVALWRVGRQSFLVEHHLSRLERFLVDTDADMVGGAAGPAAPGSGGRR